MKLIPIIFRVLPIPEVNLTSMRQLVDCIAQYMVGDIDVAQASAFKQVSEDPIVNQGLIFNTSDQVFKYWDEEKGKYVRNSDLEIGDIKHNLINADDPVTGWIKLNGRAIVDVPELTDEQRDVLNELFPSGILPRQIYITGGTPAFSDLELTDVAADMANATDVSSIAIGATYSQTELIDLRDGPSGPTGATGVEPNGFAGIAAGFEALRAAAEHDLADTREKITESFDILDGNTASVYVGPRFE